MLNFCADIGNSSVKVCVFKNNKLVHKQISNALYEETLLELKERFPGIEHAIISSVQKENKQMIDLLHRNFDDLVQFTHKTPIPVINLYESKETLGNDRLAAVVGANNMYPDKNVLVVDAGTALTFDLVNQKCEYTGGNISPGLMMRFKALHRFTGRLPMVEPSDEYLFMGNNTEKAILSGVINGMIFEIDGYIDKLRTLHKDLVAILTGGDANFFDKKLKNTIFVDQNLVLTGLNRIIEYNVKKS